MKDKVAIYLRTDKANKKSLSAQETKLRKFCEENNMVVSEVAYDLNTKQNGYKQNLEDLIISLREKGIYTIIIECISTLASNNIDLYDYYKYANDNHIHFISVDQNCNIIFKIDVIFQERELFASSELIY